MYGQYSENENIYIIVQYTEYKSLSPLSVGASSSNRSSLSGEEAEPYTGPFIGRARALVDCHPSPYDPHALKFKVACVDRQRMII